MVVRPYGLGMMLAFAACVAWCSPRRRIGWAIVCSVAAGQHDADGHAARDGPPPPSRSIGRGPTTSRAAASARTLATWGRPRSPRRRSSCSTSSVGADPSARGCRLPGRARGRGDLAVGRRQPPRRSSCARSSRSARQTTACSGVVGATSSREVPLRLALVLCLSSIMLAVGLVIAARRRVSLVFYLSARRAILVFFGFLFRDSAPSRIPVRGLGRRGVAGVGGAPSERPARSPAARRLPRRGAHAGQPLRHLADPAGARRRSSLRRRSALPFADACTPPTSSAPRARRVPLIAVVRSDAQAVGAFSTDRSCSRSKGRPARSWSGARARSQSATVRAADSATTALLDRSVASCHRVADKGRRRADRGPRAVASIPRRAAHERRPVPALGGPSPTRRAVRPAAILRVRPAPSRTRPHVVTVLPHRAPRSRTPSATRSRSRSRSYRRRSSSITWVTSGTASGR